jgi:hypothetical protein
VHVHPQGAGGNFIFDDILPEELARVTRAADRAAELGAPHLVVGGGAKRFDGTREPDYHKLGAALDRAASLLADETRFVVPQASADAFCRALDAPARDIPELTRLFAEKSVLES